MSRRVLFNGVVLIRPGAATKIDASQFEDVNLDGIGVVGLIGAADGGQPRTIQSFATASGVKNAYRSGDLVEAAAIAAQPGNDTIITAGAQLIVCYKVNGSTQSTLVKPPFTFTSQDYGLHTNDIQMSISSPDSDNGRVVNVNALDANGILINETSPKLGMTGKMTVQYLGTGGTMSVQTTATQMIFTSGASAGQVTSGPQTYSLVPGDTLVIAVDAMGDQTFTFNGTHGSITSNNQTFNLTPTPPKTVVVSIDGGADQTFTFNGTHGSIISSAGTFAITSGQHVDVKVDGGTTYVATFTGTSGVYAAGNETYNITPGQTLVVAVDGGSDQTFTFAGTQGFKLGTGATYASLNTKTLVIAHDGGADETVTFTGAAVDAASACTEINAQTTGLVATPSGGEILLTSDTYGSGSSINVKNTSTALTETGFTAGLGTAGTGDAVNLAATTKAEVVTKLSTLVGAVAAVVAMHFTITSSKVGTASSVQVKNTSTATALVADNTLHSGTGDAADFSAVTVTEAITKISGAVTGVVVDSINNAIRITSNKYGTGSSIQVMNTTTATGFGFDTAAAHSGTGDAVDLSAVTAAEVATKLSTITGATATVVVNAVKVQSNKIGTASSVKIESASTATIFPDNTLHSGTGDAADFSAVTAQEVVNKLAGLSGAVASVTPGLAVLIKSSTTGSTSMIQVESSSTADTKIGFDNNQHFGVNANSADNLTINFSDYPTLDKVVRRLNSLTGVFSAAALITGDTTWDTTYFDAQTITDIKPAAGSLFARNWDIMDWINTNSSLITASLTKGQAAPITPFLNTTFSGGTRGTSANTDWATGFTRLGGVRINQIVPLCSSDGGNGDTYTFDSVSAGAFQHAAFYSSTAGRSERQAWIGMRGTKSALIGKANIFNSADVCLIGQRIKRIRTSDGAQVFFPEWATASALAGMRAGAPLGEPLTWKYILAYGIENDPSWSTQDKTDVEDLLLNGVMMIDDVKGKGFRIERGITTYTRTDNDAYYDEGVVQAWKNVAFQLRESLEDKYIGRPNSLQIVSTVPSFVIEIMSKFQEAGLITPSLVNGQQIPAFRNIVVQSDGDKLYISVTFSPVEGIDYILNTLVIVPARISLGA